MADPILVSINPSNFAEQEYLTQDVDLISSLEIGSPFDPTVDTVELYWYDTNQQLIAANTNFIGWRTNQDSSNPLSQQLQALNLDPISDATKAGITDGDVFVIYNFVNNKLFSDENNPLYISSISADRTEIGFKSNIISDAELAALTNNFAQELNSLDFYQNFYVNFNDNNRLIALNIRSVNTATGVEVGVKLYEPLPTSYNIKSTAWIQIDVADPVGYRVTYQEDLIAPDTTVKLRNPNFNLLLNNQSGKSSEFQTSNSLKNTALTGSLSQVNNLLSKYQVSLNVDYTNYENFVHFSSAEQRLKNFYYKLSLLEQYQSNINIITGSSATSIAQSQSIAIYQGNINNIIANFDGYEYFLYYDSGSETWPKLNSTPPYTLAPTDSAAAISWYGTPGLDGTGQLSSASYYDNINQDNLVYSIPQFIREDSQNAPYELFVEMIGQHFDNLYLYTDAITQKYNADNRLKVGISKDLVADTLRSFGLKIYENNFSNDDLYTALIGLTPEGSNLPLPSITTNFPVTGSGIEYIQTIISASNNTIPLDDLNKSIYKRLYHNLPLLVKKKGTLAGLHLLRTIYGVPDTILRINEFGGKDQNTNTWDYWQDTFDYALDTQGTNFVTSSFAVNTAWGATDDVPSAVEFRFKTPGIPAASNYSQSLWSTDKNVALRLKYTGTANTSGSYSGSIVDPYNQYGYLEFFPDTTDLNSSASIYLPFFNQDWWAVLINKNSDSNYTIYAGNTVYDGNDGNTLGFTGNSTVSKLGNWSGSIDSYFGSSSLSATIFSGSLQEIRYYKNALDQSVFNDFIMNPGSIEGNSLNSAPDQLIFRAALGGELYTQSLSIHPKVSGQWATTASFAAGSDFYFNTTPVFVPNTAVAFYDQPAVGIQNAVSDKINIQGNTVYGTTLSGLASLQQNYPASQSFTRDINYLEVGYSPQNEINEDIMDSIGYFNIGEYIGDPRQISSPDASYPELDSLRNSYFQKYNKSYDYQDYFRLIKFYDNSLFKLIKDFIPARTSAATGAIVKQHLLERNRQRPAQVSYTEPYYTASVTSAARNYQTGSIETFEGGPGGSVNQWINVSQSYTASVLGPAGLVTYVESSEKEFYNGQYSGSTIDVVNGKLQDNPLLGETYRISIPDLQNLDVGRSVNYSGISASLGNPMTGTLPLDLENKQINTYNNTTYEYTPLYTVQSDVEIFVTGGFLNTTGTEDSQLTVYLKEDGKTIATGFDDNGNNGDLSLTITVPNLTIKAGSTYKLDFLYIENDNASPSTARIDTGSYWRATVENLAAQSTYYLDPTVYTQQNFPGNINEFSDYNSLLNNVYSNRVSSKYFDIDYNSDALTPTNFSTIISESAIYAQVQDSNYALTSSWTKLRYAGIKNTGTYNTGIAFASESLAPGYPIDYFTSYFAYFDWVGPANPQYPGGGNTHIVKLINAETKEVVTLSEQNKNLETISQIYKKGNPVYLIPFSASISSAPLSATIVEGGALYQTILYKSGSITGTSFLANYSGSAPFDYKAYFSTSSGKLTDTLFNNTGWLFSLMRTSSGIYGDLNPIDSYYIPTSSPFAFYNDRTGDYITAGMTASISETLLPLKYGDFIRFGTTGSGGPDRNFNNTTNWDIITNLYNIVNIAVGVDTLSPSTITTSPTITTNLTEGDQNYRIFRRIPNETFVLIQNLTYRGSGLLVPYNLDPKYSPVEIAAELGL